MMTNSLTTTDLADALRSDKGRAAARRDVLTLRELADILEAEALTRYITRDSGLSLHAQVHAYRRAYADGALRFEFDPEAIRIRGCVLPSVAHAIRSRIVTGIVIEAFPQAAPAPASIYEWSGGLRRDAEEISVLEFALLHFLARGGKVAEPRTIFDVSRRIFFDLERPGKAAYALRTLGKAHGSPCGIAAEGIRPPTLASVIGRPPRLSFVFLAREAPRTDLRTLTDDCITPATPLAFVALNAAFSEPSDPATYFGAYTFELLAATTCNGPAAGTSNWSGLDVFIPRPSVRTFRARPYIAGY